MMMTNDLGKALAIFMLTGNWMTSIIYCLLTNTIGFRHGKPQINLRFKI